MAKITYIQPDGSSVIIEAEAGNLMEIARENGVAGIDGNCGGVCSCSTCHVRVPKEWASRVGEASTTERELLDFEPNACPRSRLACQIEVTSELDGLVLEVAKL